MAIDTNTKFANIENIHETQEEAARYAEAWAHRDWLKEAKKLSNELTAHTTIKWRILCIIFM